MDGVFQFSHTHQDPEVAAAALGQLYGQAHLEAPADQAFTATCTASFAGPVSLQRLHPSGAPATFRVDAPDYLKIGQLLGGHLPIEAGTTVTAVDALPFLFPASPTPAAPRRANWNP